MTGIVHPDLLFFGLAEFWITLHSETVGFSARTSPQNVVCGNVSLLPALHFGGLSSDFIDSGQAIFKKKILHPIERVVPVSVGDTQPKLTPAYLVDACTLLNFHIKQIVYFLLARCFPS